MKASTTIFTIFLLAIFISFINTYKFNVTVQMANESSFKPVDGRLALSLYGLGKKNKTILGYRNETFYPGRNYSYPLFSQHLPGNFSSASLEFNATKSGFFRKPKIYVYRIIVDPVFISNSSARRLNTRKFCGPLSITSIKHREDAPFRYNCF